jgi:hypothetical protein
VHVLGRVAGQQGGAPLVVQDAAEEGDGLELRRRGIDGSQQQDDDPRRAVVECAEVDALGLDAHCANQMVDRVCAGMRHGDAVL